MRRTQSLRWTRVCFALGLLTAAFAPLAEAGPWIDDCGLEPPGHAWLPPVPARDFEQPVRPGEPPTVRRLPAIEARSLGIPSAHLGAGPLQGKTVYLSAGHGFTWNSTLSAWSTQRGNTNELVEDLISAETVSQYLMPMLLNAGATVTTVRESDLNPHQVVVDDFSPGYQEVGPATAFGDSTLPGYGAPPEPINGTVNPFALGKNRLVDAAPEVSATARWTPVIPADGFYNVYIAYTAHSARVDDAHFTVHHAGGSTPFAVNQRHHGGTWVLLGRFFFRRGESAEKGSVEVTNQSHMAGNVSLDAVRFGGGMGSIDRGQGTSQRPRFEESCRYHAQLLGAPASVYALSGVDRTDDVDCRSRLAAWDHEAGEDALYVAWHTNAFNTQAAGTNTYVYGPNPPDGSYTFTGTPGSDLLAKSVHTELINDLGKGMPLPNWKDRGVRSAYFGEINPSNNAEMPAILIEVAFHDNTGDATQLKEPRFRSIAARAIVQGIIKYFAARDAVPALLPPDPPTALSAVNRGVGLVELRWRAPDTDAMGIGGQAATGYRVYQSVDGYSWDEGAPASSTSLALSLVPGQVRYFRVVAVNGGGASFPSSTVGVGVSTTTAPVLLVDAFDRLEAATAPTENLGSFGLGSPLRLLLEKMNDGTYLRRHGEAVAYANLPFDSLSADALIGGDFNLASYQGVDWMAGRGHPLGAAPTSAEQALLRAYVAGGGKLLFSGSHAALALARGTAADQAFLSEVLNASADGLGSYAVDVDPHQWLAPLNALELDDGRAGAYDIGASDGLFSLTGVPLAHYGSGRGAAVASSGVGKVVFLGFPFEGLTSTPRRLEVMGKLLHFFGLIDAEPLSPPDGQVLTVIDSRFKAVKGCGCGATEGAAPGLLLLALGAARARRRKR